MFHNKLNMLSQNDLKQASQPKTYASQHKRDTIFLKPSFHGYRICFKPHTGFLKRTGFRLTFSPSPLTGQSDEGAFSQMFSVTTKLHCSLPSSDIQLHLMITYIPYCLVRDEESQV